MFTDRSWSKSDGFSNGLSTESCRKAMGIQPKPVRNSHPNPIPYTPDRSPLSVHDLCSYVRRVTDKKLPPCQKNPIRNILGFGGARLRFWFYSRKDSAQSRTFFASMALMQQSVVASTYEDPASQQPYMSNIIRSRIAIRNNKPQMRSLIVEASTWHSRPL